MYAINSWNNLLFVTLIRIHQYVSIFLYKPQITGLSRILSTEKVGWVGWGRSGDDDHQCCKFDYFSFIVFLLIVLREPFHLNRYNDCWIIKSSFLFLAFN